MNKKTVKDVEVKGKKVLVRCDFNVPMKDGVITDENRIVGALPTIKYLMEQGAKVVLCSHMGKPHNVFDSKLELNKKEKAKVSALPENEQAKATEEFLEKAKKVYETKESRIFQENMGSSDDGIIAGACLCRLYGGCRYVSYH